MDIRKVQLSGGSSYIVSLPKKWIIAANIKKNDPIGLLAQDDGTLLITPNISGSRVQRTKDFVVDATTGKDRIIRDLIGAYIAGYTTIRVTAQSRLPAVAIEATRDFTRMAVGQECVEESETKIVLRDLLNPSEMPMPATIRRMAVIVMKMQEDALNAIQTGDRSLAESVINRDNDVDRLHWLISRQANLIYQDVSLAQKMGISTTHAAAYAQVAKLIERVGDHGTRTGKNALALIDSDLEEELFERIRRVNVHTLGVFRTAVNLFLESVPERAHETIEQTPCLEEECRTINKRALNYEATLAVHIINISDSIRRIGDYSTDICEIEINSSM